MRSVGLRGVWFAALALASGCAAWTADLQRTSTELSTDAQVQPAVGTSAATRESQASSPPPLPDVAPPATERRPAETALTPGPSEAERTELDRLAATGQPLPLPEAIELAFRTQPRLRALSWIHTLGHGGVASLGDAGEVTPRPRQRPEM